LPVSIRQQNRFRYSYLTGYESGGAQPGRFDIPPGKRGQIYDAASRVVQQAWAEFTMTEVWSVAVL
jgi:hypothetical protein